MTLHNNANERLIEQRREIVARLHLRKLSYREIEAALAAQGLVNPDNGKPYTYGTIKNDIDYLRTQWRENAAQDFAQRRADQLAEIEELRRLGWKKEDTKIILRAIELEAKLLGTTAPEKVDTTVSIKWASPFEDE